MNAVIAPFKDPLLPSGYNVCIQPSSLCLWNGGIGVLSKTRPHHMLFPSSWFFEVDNVVISQFLHVPPQYLFSKTNFVLFFNSAETLLLRPQWNACCTCCALVLKYESLWLGKTKACLPGRQLSYSPSGCSLKEWQFGHVCLNHWYVMGAIRWIYFHTECRFNSLLWQALCLVEKGKM